MAAPPALLPAGQRVGTVGGKTILVVDDDKVIRGLCRAILESADFTVLEAENGQEAKSILQSAAPVALLITDVEMPDLSGPGLVQEVLPQVRSLKVLYISGSTRENRLLQRHILESGCGFLAKPFTPDLLLTRVRGLLVGVPEAGAAQRAPGW